MSLLRTIHLTSIVLALVFSPIGTADTVETRDGDVYVGYVLETTSAELKLYTKVNNVETTLTLKHRDIASIKMGNIPEGYLRKSRDEATGTKPVDKPVPPTLSPETSENDGLESTSNRPTVVSKKPRYAVVPVHGTIGDEETGKAGGVYASGVKDALLWASRQKVDYIVFDINTNGGSVSEAEQIRDILKQHDSQFRYVAHIQKAISAALWIVVSCDDIFVSSDSATGAALSYSETSTGELQVDAKRNSAFAAILTSIAESKSHNSDVVRAMIMPEIELFTWKDQNSFLASGSNPPATANDVKKLDDKDQILTLTARQAAEIGFCRFTNQSIDKLSTLLNIAPWQKAGGYSEVAMGNAARARQGEFDSARKDADEVAHRSAKIKDVLATLDHLASTADRLDPTNFTYGYDTETGLFTPTGRREWQSHTDDAVRAWRTLIDALAAIENHEKRIKELDGERVSNRSALISFGTRADREIDRLRSTRDKLGI